MHFKFYISILFSFLICKSSLGFNADTSKTKTLEPINITSSRSALKNSETPFRIQNFSTFEIQNLNIRSIPEFLSNSYFLQKTNHGGGSLFLRGLTGNQTLTLIDGIRLNNSTFRYGPNQYLNTINQNMVKEIEVLSGSGSVQYGSDAIGGLVQIFSLEPDFNKKMGLNLSSRIGSKGMEKSLNTRLNLTNKKLGLLLSGSIKDFGDLVAGKGIGKQIPSGYKENSFEAKCVWKIHNNFSITSAYQFFNQTNVPIYHKVLLEDFKINEISLQNRELSYVKLDNKTSKSLFASQNVTLSRQNNSEERNLQKNKSPLFRTENDRIKTNGVSVTNISIPNRFWTFTSGYEVYHDKVNSSRSDKTNGVIVAKRGLYPDDATYLNQSIFNIHQLNFKTYFINAGLRWNTVKMEIPDETLGASEIKNKAFVYNLNILKKINSSFGVFCSFNTAFRAPNIDDMGTLGIVDFRYEIPSSNLKPEKSRQLEIGFKGSSSRFQMQFNAFQNNLSDLISREKLSGQTIENYQVYLKMNTGKAVIRGLEWNNKNQLTNRLILSSNVIYTFGQDLTKNMPQRRIPPLFGNLFLDYSISKFLFKPSLNIAGAQRRLAPGDIDDNRIGKNGTAAYTVTNFLVSYNTKFFDVNLNLLNLSNKVYKNHGSGIYGYGRSAFTSITLKL